MSAPVQDFEDLSQEILGIGAELIGTAFDVYRLSDGGDGRPATQGSLLNGEPLIRDFYAEFHRVNQAKDLETTPIYDMVFVGLCDATDLRVGDVLVEQDPDKPIGGMFTVADLRPLKRNVFVRTEVAGSLSRSYGLGGTTKLQGKIGYQGAGKTSEFPVIVENGYYYIGDNHGDEPAVPAAIPFGIQPYKRLGPASKLAIPTATHRTEAFVYMPLLQGFLLQQGDVLSDQNGNRYMIHTLLGYNVGIQGYQIIAESLYV